MNHLWPHATGICTLSTYILKCLRAWKWQAYIFMRCCCFLCFFSSSFLYYYLLKFTCFVYISTPFSYIGRNNTHFERFSMERKTLYYIVACVFVRCCSTKSSNSQNFPFSIHLCCAHSRKHHFWYNPLWDYQRLWFYLLFLKTLGGKHVHKDMTRTQAGGRFDMK